MCWLPSLIAQHISAAKLNTRSISILTTIGTKNTNFEIVEMCAPIIHLCMDIKC